MRVKRVDEERGTNDDRAEIKRPGLGRHDDRQAERRALVRTSEIHGRRGLARLRDRQRATANAGSDRGRSHLRCGRAAPGRGLGLWTARHRADITQQAGRERHVDTAEVLLAIRPGHLQGERGATTGLRVDDPGGHRRLEPRRPITPLISDHRHVAVDHHTRPRRQLSTRRIRTTSLGHRQRSAVAGLQREHEARERQLRIVVQRRRQPTRHRVGLHLGGSLMTVPDFASSTATYIASSVLNGLSFCLAR